MICFFRFDPISKLKFIFSHSALREGWDNPLAQQHKTIPRVNTTVIKDLRSGLSEEPFEFRPDTITHKFHEYYKEAGIEGANVHSLRKTFGSLLLQNGKADLYTVSKLLGHTSIKTTEKYYVDLLDENYRSSVKHLEDILPIISYEENA